MRVCAFRIINDFAIFCLHKTDNETLEFPECSPSQVDKMLDKELNPTFIGSLIHEGNTYVWYDCGRSEVVQPLFGKKSDKKWWVLSSEIINWRKVLHFPVEESVVHLFLRNSDMLFVEDDNGDKYECPIVGYYGAYYTKILKLAIIGASKSEWKFSSMGPYYYFGNYDAGMKYAVSPMTLNESTIYHAGEKIIRDDGKYIRGGIARFALKLGNEHTMLLGKQRDRSQYTRKGVKEGFVRSEDSPFRDHDSKWTKDFDAILLGRRKVISRSTGKEKILNPQYVIKSFKQHIPLSFHYVETNTINTESAIIE